MAVKDQFRLLWAYLGMSLKTLLEYRLNALLFIGSMIINDLAWMLFWLLFFTRFPNVNGWDFSYMIILYAVICFSYGLASGIFRNANKLQNIIANGTLDYFLPLPKNILYHLLIEKSSQYSLGDILFGLVLAVIFIPIYNFPLFLILSLLSATIIISFQIIIGSISFYIGNSRRLSASLNGGVMSLSSYPLSIYHGIARFIILFLIPAGFLAGVPVELLKSFNLTWFLLLTGFTIAILLIAIGVFYKGLKRYESGNQMYVRS